MLQWNIFVFCFYETTKTVPEWLKLCFEGPTISFGVRLRRWSNLCWPMKARHHLGRRKRSVNFFYIFNVGNQLYEIARWQKCFGLAWSWQYCYGYSQSTFNAQSAWVELSKLNNILLAFCHFKVLARSFGLVIVYHVILVKDR